MSTDVRSWKSGILRKGLSKDILNIHHHPWYFSLSSLTSNTKQSLSNRIQIFGSNRHVKLSLCANSRMVIVPRIISTAFDTGTNFTYPIMCTESFGDGNNCKLEDRNLIDNTSYCE